MKQRVDDTIEPKLWKTYKWIQFRMYSMREPNPSKTYTSASEIRPWRSGWGTPPRPTQTLPFYVRGAPPPHPLLKVGLWPHPPPPSNVARRSLWVNDCRKYHVAGRSLWVDYLGYIILQKDNYVVGKLFPETKLCCWRIMFRKESSLVGKLI